MIQIVNKHYHQPTTNTNDFYIGRGSPLGNPFTSIKNRKTKAQFTCENREESVEKYKEYLLQAIKDKNPTICNKLNEIYIAAKKAKENNSIVYLVCFCAPKLCHGDVLKEIINQKLKS